MNTSTITRILKIYKNRQKSMKHSGKNSLSDQVHRPLNPSHPSVGCELVSLCRGYVNAFHYCAGRLRVQITTPHRTKKSRMLSSLHSALVTMWESLWELVSWKDDVTTFQAPVLSTRCRDSTLPVVSGNQTKILFYISSISLNSTCLMLSGFGSNTAQWHDQNWAKKIFQGFLKQFIQFIFNYEG